MSLLPSLTRAAHYRALSHAMRPRPTRAAFGRTITRISPFSRFNCSLTTVQRSAVLKDDLDDLTREMETLSLKTKKLKAPPILFLFHLNGMSAALEQATKKLNVFEVLHQKAKVLQEEALALGVAPQVKIEPLSRRSSDFHSSLKALNHIEFCLRSLENTEASTRCYIKKVQEQLMTLKTKTPPPAAEKITQEKMGSDLQKISEALKQDIKLLEKAESVVLDAVESERLKKLYDQVNLAYSSANAVFNHVLLLHCELTKIGKKT